MHLRPEGGRQHLTARHPERAIEVLPARRRRLEAQAAGSIREEGFREINGLRPTSTTILSEAKKMARQR
jgi:hypothetical protein